MRHRRWSRTVRLGFGAAVLVLGASVIAPSTAGAVLRTARCLPTHCAQVTADAAYVLGLQEPTGAIDISELPEGAWRVSGYDGAYAASGLALASHYTQSSTDAAGAWAWLGWYAQQMALNAPSDIAGGCQNQLPGVATLAADCFYVPDECTHMESATSDVGVSNTVQNGTVDPTRDQVWCLLDDEDPSTGIAQATQCAYATLTQCHLAVDATDAQAAMFLVALSRAYQQTGNMGALVGVDRSSAFPFSDVVTAAVDAIASTVDPNDGLSFATPWYASKLLDDNAEVYAGLQAAAQLEAVLTSPPAGSGYAPGTLGSTATASRALSMASRIQSALLSHVVTTPVGQQFANWAVPTAPGNATNWSDAAWLSPSYNAWAVLWGLVSPSSPSAGAIVASINQYDAPSAAGACSSTWTPQPTYPGGPYPQPLYGIGLAEFAAGNLSGASNADADLNSVYESATPACQSSSDPPAPAYCPAGPSTCRNWAYQPKDAGMSIWLTTSLYPMVAPG